MYMFFGVLWVCGSMRNRNDENENGRGKLIYAFRYSVKRRRKRRMGKEGGENETDQKSSTRDLRTGKERLKNVKSR